MKKNLIILLFIAVFLESSVFASNNIFMETEKGSLFSLPQQVNINGANENVSWEQNTVSTATEGLISISGTTRSGEVRLWVAVKSPVGTVQNPERKIDFERKTGSFSADASSGETGTLIILKSEDAAEIKNIAKENIKAIQSAEEKNGKLSFDVDLKNFSGGEYTFYITSNGASASGNFEYLNYDEFITELKSIGTDDLQKGEKVLSLFEKYAAMVDLKLENVYNAMSETEKAEILAIIPEKILNIGSGASLSDIFDAVDCEIAVSEFLKTDDMKNLLESAEPYADVLGLDLSASGWYGKVKGYSALYEGIKAAAPQTREKIRDAFYKSMAVVLMNESNRANVYERLGGLSEIGGMKILDISQELSQFDKMDEAEKNSILAEFSLINDFESCPDIKNRLKNIMLNKTLSDDTDNRKPQGGGGGGGGGGAGGGYSKGAGTAALTPDNNGESKTAGGNEMLSDRFSDVSEAEWAREYINKLSDLKIISGFENKIRPNDPISREEIAKLVSEALELSENGGKLPFDDVKKGEWYEEYIKNLYSAGIMQGISEKSFGLGEYLTREDMATLIYRAMQYKGSAQSGAAHETEFSDGESISGYAKEAVYAMKEKGIISGVGDNCFMPKGICSRAMAFKVIAEAFFK